MSGTGDPGRTPDRSADTSERAADRAREHALVEAARAGDRAAMESLLRSHADRVFAVCRRITGSDADAADAAQEAMIAVVRNLGRFDGRSSFGTWVYRIATNASLDELRRRRRRPGPADTSDLPPDHDPRQSDPAATRAEATIEDRLLLEPALQRIPEEFRVPLVLRDVGDLDYAEIADTLGVPIGTVKSRIARGRAALAHQVRSGNQTAPERRPTPGTSSG
jgi:RNA polymerase sigma-70 factor (ECF subfamily)